MTPTPRAAGKRSRADLGLRPPLSRSRRIEPGQGGCTLHWGGPPASIRTHADCERTWRGWQTFHTKVRGWVDIAYTAGVCQHGYVLAGRGYGVRTAAQGTNRGNEISYAFCHINDTTNKPTQQALDAMTWLVADARAHGGAGTRVWPHKAWHSTACPGNTLAALAAHLDREPIAPAHLRKDDDMPTAREIADAILDTPVPGGDVGTDEQPLTFRWMLRRDYHADFAALPLLGEIKALQDQILTELRALAERTTR